MIELSQEFTLVDKDVQLLCGYTLSYEVTAWDIISTSFTSEQLILKKKNSFFRQQLVFFLVRCNGINIEIMDNVTTISVDKFCRYL